jgi:hypothetical protein
MAQWGGVTLVGPDLSRRGYEFGLEGLGAEQAERA